VIFDTLTVRTGKAVLFAEITARPMNLLGSELVRDLVSLIQQCETDDAASSAGGGRGLAAHSSERWHTRALASTGRTHPRSIAPSERSAVRCASVMPVTPVMFKPS
jgi:hypothetical protein